MLPSAGEIVKRPHTSLTHNFQSQKNVHPKKPALRDVSLPVECRARTSSCYLILVRMLQQPLFRKEGDELYIQMKVKYSKTALL